MARYKVGWTAAAISILWGLSGCAGVGKPLESPRISLANLQAQESTGFETVFLVQLRILNPNEVDLDIRGVDCELEVNGRPFAYGISNTAVKVPAFGSETVPVTVYSSVIDIVRGVFGWQGREELSYHLKGKVRVEGGAWMPSALRFDSQGTVSFRDIPSGLKVPS
jgi:LEA14-like dessication related protein